MRPGVDGVLLGRQTKRVPTHGVQHVEASHALHVGELREQPPDSTAMRGPAAHLVASQNVRGRVAFRVAHVQTRAATARRGEVRQSRAQPFSALLPHLGYGNMSSA